MPTDRSDVEGRPGASGQYRGPAGAARTVERCPSLGRVLVTGGGGFVGRHLTEVLATENDVRVLDTFEHGRPDDFPEPVTAVEGDVRDRVLLSEALSDVDVVVHLAGQVSVERSLDRPRRSHETNVTATLELLELARREGVRVVFASSAAVYGDPESLPVSESDRLQPRSPYGVEKLAADHYVRLYARQYDLPAVALRYFNVYGPGATGGVVDAFARRALAGEPLTIHGDGTQTRDFVHVDDVVRATVAAAATDRTGGAYNVGTGERTSVAEVADLVRGAVGHDVPVRHEPPREGDVTHSVASTERAERHLDYEPRVDVEGGIPATVAALADDR